MWQMENKNGKDRGIILLENSKDLNLTNIYTTGKRKRTFGSPMGMRICMVKNVKGWSKMIGRNEDAFGSI